MINPYIVATEWILTSSKIKDFIRSPQLYYVKYEKKIELEEEDKRCFVVGSAFDTLVSYGKEAFLEKYYIDDWLVVDELKQKLIAQGNDPDMIMKLKLSQLRAMYYNDAERIRLTPWEGKDIMGMYREVMRQPICDLGNEWYLLQHRVDAEYKWVKVGWTLDRYHPEKKLIRDWKTSGRIDRFAYDIENTFDYILSMSFYFLLVYLNDKTECDVILDVVGKSVPYPYIGYELNKKILLEKLNNTVKPALDFYIECKKNNERPAINPITKHPVDRMTLMNDPYYPYLDSVLCDGFIDPRDQV